MKERQTDEGCSDVGTWRQINDKAIKRQTGLAFSQTMTESVSEQGLMFYWTKGLYGSRWQREETGQPTAI